MNQTIRYAVDTDGIAQLVIDVPNRPMNVMTPEFLSELGIDGHTISPGYDYDAAKKDMVERLNLQPENFFLTRKMTIDPAQLHGSQIISFMGGSQIELTNTGEHEGPVIVEVLAMWGGIEIRVPSGWEVIAEAVPVMGGIDIKTAGAPGGKQLVVRGLVFMAGMEIKNVRTS